MTRWLAVFEDRGGVPRAKFVYDGDSRGQRPFWDGATTPSPDWW